MRPTHFRHLCALLLALVMMLAAGSSLAEKTITLTFTGDVTLGGKDDERNYPDCFDNVAKEKGYDYFFANFRELFEQDDLTVINLEGPLTDSKANRASKTHPMRGSTDFAKILPISGIDAASLSNNHIADYGKQGDANTKQALEENGVHWFQDYEYYIFEKDGIRIALFALQNSVLYTQRAKFTRAITRAREEDGANAVVICWHTGTEYKGYHDRDTENKVTALIEEGWADLIIINHSHVAQGAGIVNNRMVFYSLGNFVFGGNRNIRTGKGSKDPYAISLYAMVVQAKLTFSDAGQYLGQQITVYPVFSSSVRPDYQVGDGFPPYDRAIFPNNYQPMRLTLDQASAVYECIRRDSTFEIPQMTEKNGLAEIAFPYLPAFDGVMLPEEESGGAVGLPEASNPTPTRNVKMN